MILLRHTCGGGLTCCWSQCMLLRTDWLSPTHRYKHHIVAIIARVLKGVTGASTQCQQAAAKHVFCLKLPLPQVGSALVELLTEGVVKREQLFITSKLWNSNHAADAVKPALEKTLADLGVSSPVPHGSISIWYRSLCA